MPQEVTPERLADLLVDPHESLDFEVKNWLDIQNNNDDKATVAKAILALSNHGGGFIALGLTETDQGIVEADDRPDNLEGYSQDLINGIVQNYCDPSFHCEVHVVTNPDGALFPVIVVPGSHRVPVRARRAGPNGNIVQNHAIYLRKPGPRSETPQSSQDWDELLARCLNNRRDELFDQIRGLITGAVPQVAQEADQPDEYARLDAWIDECYERWQTLINELPEHYNARLPHGYFNFAYEIIGQHRHIPVAQLPETLRDSVVRHSGWPPFWYPTREGIEPYPINDAVECWLGLDRRAPEANGDAAHADFWRIHQDGLAFLLRGFQEDSMGELDPDRGQIPPASVFDVTLPVWRIGETLLHAQSLAAHLFEGPATIRFIAHYRGLNGRELTNIERRRILREGRVARQDDIRLSTHVDADVIDANLPEIVHPLLSPLYALFDFYELPMNLVVEELARMRGG